MNAPGPHGIGDTAATRELLRRLDLEVRMRLDGLLHGDYRGLVPGHGSELGETREYQPGDDVRRIDWNVTARLQETHVRETIADRELETNILIDLSPSLDFGTANQEKRDLAMAATAAIGLLTARVGNRVGALLASPEGVTHVPAAQGRQHLMAILHRVAETPRHQVGSVDLAAAMERLGSIGRRRGLLVVLSDFLTSPTWHRPLAQLGARHEVIAVEIIDPRELSLPDVGVITLTDPETGRQRDVPTQRAAVRERYARAAADQRQEIAEAITRAGAGHLQLRTDRDWLLDIAAFIISRRRRHEGVARPV